MQTIIAAHITGKNVQESYLFASLQNIAERYSNCTIVIFTTEIFATEKKNIEVKNIGTKNKIAKAYWYNFTLPKLLQNATCFITNDKLCSKLNIPQYFFVEEDITKVKPTFIKTLQQATNIFVVENFFKMHLDNYLPKEKTISILHGLQKTPLQLSYNQIKSIQGEYTNGYDYFLFFVNTSSKENIITVLKAFSIVKKWQKTSMKLLLLLDNVEELDLIPDFKNHKHKADVEFVTSTANNFAPIIASAFACLHFANYSSIKNAFVALQNDIPVITTDTEMHKGIFKNAVLYTSITDKNIAENMQQLYKDEQLKKELLHDAKALFQNYNAEKATEDLYKNICTT
jgi:hypothetical protein